MTRLSVSADPLPLVIQAGSGTLSATDARARYSLVTNLRGMRITASLDRSMPAGTSLAVRFESSHGSSKGDVDITSASGPAEVVAGIGPGADRDRSITYIFTADPSLAALEPSSRTVTLTLTD